MAAEKYNVGRQGQLWEAVAESLLSRIVNGEFPADSIMPAEGLLSEEYGVSRPTVRDAMKVLQEKGLIRTQHGVGSVVLPPEAWSVLDPAVITARLQQEQTGESVFDQLSVVRIALESELASRAAVSATDADIETMAVLLAQMDSVQDDPDAYLELDVRFHGLVMQSSGNRMGMAMMTAIGEPLRQSRRITNRIPHGVESAHKFHREIFEHIAARDAASAAASMREHLTWSWDRYRALRGDDVPDVNSAT